MTRRRRWRWAGVALAVLLGLVVLALAALAIVPGVTGRYRNSTPALAAAYRAKETCSCVFVQGRDEGYCRAWTVASPDIARAELDRAARIVRARALGLWTARARYVDARRGCVLE
ncbi:MAG TPA: hypothetical protein VEB43_00840 [Anaeromyxobacter sp.]|nr:hypothetical protein [Anaeromyxobacter sp.]